MTKAFWKFMFVICVVGSFGAFASYTHGRVVSREWSGHSAATSKMPPQREAMPVVLVRHDSLPKSKKRYEYPFACEDTDKPCLTLLAAKENPRQWKSNKVSDMDNVPLHKKGRAIAEASH